MKFFIMNRFIHVNTVKMLCERFSSNECYKDYCMIMELDALNHIDKIKSDGYKVIYYDLEHIDNALYNPEKNRVIYDGDKSGCIRLADKLNQLYECGVIDELWTYTIENKEYYKSIGMDYVKYCPFLYTENALNLTVNNKSDKLIEVLFYGGLTDYRINNIILPIQDAGFRMVIAHAFMGHELDFLIASSKIVLDCRRTESPEFNQNIIRQFYPVINSTCVLAQTSRNDNYMGDSVVYFNDKKDLIEQCRMLLITGKWREVANQSRMKYKRICESGDIWHTSDIHMDCM